MESVQQIAKQRKLGKEIAKMTEKTWQERFPGFVQGYKKHSITPEQLVDRLKDAELKNHEELTQDEALEHVVLVRGVLDFTFRKDAKGEYVLLTSDEEIDPKAEVKVYPRGPKEKEIATYFLGWPVTIGAFPLSASTLRKDGIAEASLSMHSLFPYSTFDVCEEAQKNSLGKPKDDDLYVYLAQKIYKGGGIKVAVVGPQKNGVEQFRQYFERLAEIDDDLNQWVEWNHVDVPLIPRGYSEPVVERFYKSLAGKIQEISNSLENYDAICLVQGDGPVKSLARLNNPTVGFAVVRSAVPVITALGNSSSYLWLNNWSDAAVMSIPELAYEFYTMVQTVKHVMNPEEESSDPLGINLEGLCEEEAVDEKKINSTKRIRTQNSTSDSTKPSKKTAKPADAKSRAKPTTGPAPKSAKASAAKVAPVAATTTKSPKATRASTPKATCKTATKTSNTISAKDSNAAKAEQDAKDAKRLRSRLLLAVLFFIIVVAAVVYTQQS